MDQLLLRGRQHSQAAAGRDHQLQLLRRVHPTFAHLSHAERSQGDPGGRGHEREEWRGDGHEKIHRPGDCQSDPLGTLQGNRLGNHFAEDDHQIGDQHEGDDDGHSVRVEPGVGQGTEQRLQNAGHRGLADPAQGQTGHGDAELHGVEDVVELLMELVDGARAQAVGRDHLLQPRLAHVDQREFSGHEERVCRDQQHHHHDAQHNEGNHEAEILPSEKGPERLAGVTGQVGASAISHLRSCHYERSEESAFVSAGTTRGEQQIPHSLNLTPTSAKTALVGGPVRLFVMTIQNHRI